MTPLDARRNALVFVAGALFVAGFFVVQHLRNAWPFSLHHGADSSAAGHSDHPTDPPAASHAGHRVAVRVSTEHRERFGIRTVTLRREELARHLRAVATVVPDESRVSHVHTRVSGWIETLEVRTTGETVRAGQNLASIFSQELLASQTEYLAVRQAGAAGGETPLARGARERLAVLGMTESEIRALERRGRASRTVSIPAPRSGTVLNRGVTLGMSVDPSTELFTIADLSRVWVLVEVPEARAHDVRVGTAAVLEVPGAGIAEATTTVEFVYPTLTEQTRTLRVRFGLDNESGRLRPGMFGTVSFRIEPREGWVVPRDAVVDTGIARHVFVERADGAFEPRVVRVGAELSDQVEILDGLAAGERVATSGVFLLDSESRLQASGPSGGHAGHGD